MSDYDISMYENQIYSDIYDYMDYKRKSELLINLNAIKICEFFSQYLIFDLPEKEYSSEDEEYI